MRCGRYFPVPATLPIAGPLGRRSLRPRRVLLGLMVGLVSTAVGGLRGAEAFAQEADPQRAEVPLDQIAGAVVLPPARENAEEPQVRARCEAARRLMEEREFARAVAELDAALSGTASPGYEVFYLLALAKYAMGRYGEARLAAEHALVCQPGAADAHMLLGRLHRQQGRTDAAVAHFRSATLAAEREPNNPRVTLAWYELGMGLAEQGYLLAAEQALKRFDQTVWVEHPDQRDSEEVSVVLKQHPYGTIETRLGLLRRLGRVGELPQAAEWAFRNQPGEPYLERLYVQMLLEAGQPATAFELCRKRLHEVTGDERYGPTPLTLAIETGRAAGRLEEWVRELTADVSAGRNLGLAQALAGRLNSVGDHGPAIPLWQALVAARPDDPDVVWALAGTLKEAGNLAAALEALINFVRRAADREVHEPQTVDIPPQRLAEWMRSFEATEEFLRLVADFTARSDCDFATYTVLAATAAAAGQSELAERLFTAALDERPSFPLAHVAWGRSLLAAYRWNEAREHAQQALAAAPRLCPAHLLLADACDGLDENEAAEQAYRAAVTDCPTAAVYALALARHYRRTGNLLSAQRYFQQAWSLDHTLAEAVEELLDCYIEGGKAEVARNCLVEAEASDVSDDTLRRMRTALRFAGVALQEEHLTELASQLAQHPVDLTTGLKLASGLYARERIDEARRVLLQLQPRAADDERLMQLLARVHLRGLEAEPATQLAERLAQRYPRRAPVLRLLADAYIVDFRIDEARQALQRMLELDCTAEQRLLLREELLSLYLELSEFEGALEQVEKWVAEEPAEAAWQRAKARVLLAAKRSDEALAYAAARLEPTTAQFEELRRRHSAARERVQQVREAEQPRIGEEADAVAQLENVERQLQEAARELFERRSDYVQVAMEARAYAAAEERLRAWLADRPVQPNLQEWLVEVLLAARQGEQARELVASLVPKAPTDVLKVLIWRARAAALVGKREEGLNDLVGLLEEGFIRDSPAARAQVRQEILELLMDAREHQRAVDLCDRWLAGAPQGDEVDRLGILALKRYVLQAAGRLDESMAVAEQFLELDPHDPGLNNDLGYTWADRGRQIERATRMVVLAVAAEPLNAAYLDSLGWVYYKRGDFAAARKYLERASRLRKGQDATIYDHLGDAEYRLGDRRAARQRWQTAVRLLTATEDAALPVQDAQLLAAVREKLAACERSDPVPVAPTAAEQQEPEQP